MFEIVDDEEDDAFWEKLPLDEFRDDGEPPHISCVYTDNNSGKVPVHASSSSDLTNNKTALVSRPLLAPIQNNNGSTSSKGKMGESKIIGESSERAGKSGTKRKFPGPAGVLPESFLTAPAKLQPESPQVVRERDIETLPPSQPSSSSDVFSSNPWKSLISDIGPDASSVLTKFSIKVMLLKASKRVLPKGKIPLVLAFIDSVDFHGCDGSVVLRDPSGKVQGALHHDLIKDPITALRGGCAIVLRQTSVISPSPRTHYLNITPANIVVIYSPARDSSVLKSPWSPAEQLTSQPFLSLTQIIREADKELALDVTSPPVHQDTTLVTTLFRGVTNPSLPVHNRFVSPLSSHTAVPSSRQSPAPPRHPTRTCFNSSSPSIRHNGVSVTPTVRCVVPNKPSSSRQTPQQTNMSVWLPMDQKSSPAEDEFPDDDSDLLSLCANIDMFNGNASPSNCNENRNRKDEDLGTSSHPHQDQTNLNLALNTKDSSFQKFPHSLNAAHPNISSAAPVINKQQKTFDFINAPAGAAGRDARIQLGVAQTSGNGSIQTFGLETKDGTWDDDLSDELLSQL